MEQKVQTKPKKKLSGKQKYDMITETAFACLQIVALFVLYFLVKDVIKVRKELMELNPSYPFPKVSDLSKSVVILLFVLVFKTTFESFFVHIGPKIMKDKYKNPQTVADQEMAKILPGKIARHFYKITMYTILTITQYFILKDQDYFPKSLLGHGEMKNMFKYGYPNSYYQPRSKAFDWFYLTALAVSITDLFSLLSLYGTQSDFKNMLLHHTCTVSLIVFSYLTNYSAIGSIVYFIHNISDIPNHFTKLFLRINVPEIYCNVAGITFMLGFIYFRMYVFIDVIYTIYFYINWKWGWVTFSLTLFLVFLLIMDINWTMILVYKFIKLLGHEKITDNVDFAAEDKKDKLPQDKNKKEN